MRVGLLFINVMKDFLRKDSIMFISMQKFKINGSCDLQHYDDYDVLKELYPKWVYEI